MKRHPIDYLSLTAGLGFALVAASTLSDQRWFGTGQWIGPIILIALGLLVLAPKRPTLTAEPAPSEADTIDADVLAASHEELPESIVDDV